MEFEEFKEIDQVKPSDRENTEKDGINIKHENAFSLFKLNQMATLQKATVTNISISFILFKIYNLQH